MQLCYRGVPYQKNPTTIPSIECEVVGKYRGKPWRKRFTKCRAELHISVLSIESLK